MAKHRRPKTAGFGFQVRVINAAARKFDLPYGDGVSPYVQAKALIDHFELDCPTVDKRERLTFAVEWMLDHHNPGLPRRKTGAARSNSPDIKSEFYGSWE